MISDTSKLLRDFKAILASLTTEQVGIIQELTDAINERLEELKEDIMYEQGLDSKTEVDGKESLNQEG